jgi:hypothetical protein
MSMRSVLIPMGMLVFLAFTMGMFRGALFAVFFSVAVFMGMLVGVRVLVLVAMDIFAMGVLVGMLVGMGMFVKVLMRLFGYHNIYLGAI